MNSRSIHFLLAATTVFSGILISNSPAKAHGFDYCIEVLNNEAQIADTGTSQLQLEKKYPKEYKELLQECDPELEANGLLTVREVREKKNNKQIAKLITRLNRLTRDSLDGSKIKLQKSDLDRREGSMRRLRQKICANPKPEQEYACPEKESLKSGSVIPQSAAPKANNPLISAAMGFGNQISQILLGAVPVRNTLVAALPSISDTSVKQPSLSNPGGTLMAQASSMGQWSAPINWPHIVVHAAVGPNGKVLTWTRPKLSPNNLDGQPSPRYILWDPANNSFSSVPSVNTDIFCAGHAFAPSGNLLVVGGHSSDVAGDGSRDINVYNFNTNSWLQYPNKMEAGRWYPTVTYNANSEAAIIGGGTTGERSNPRVEAVLNSVPEVWGPTGARIRTLTSASTASFIHTNNNKQYKGIPVKPYTWNFLAPSGRIFNAGPTRTTRALDITGTGKWFTVSSHPQINRYYGSAVMYDDGKVLVMGGSDNFYGLPTNSAEVIELFKSNQWIPVGDMQYRRRHHTATLLADGKVFVSGGTSEDDFNDPTGSVRAAEIWDPATVQWTTVASMQVERSYHQTAVLLPDARVLVVGGGLPAANGRANDPDRRRGNFNGEIYSPPYLFDEAGQPATRPTITSAPATVSYDETFTVQTPDAGSISKVHWIKLSSFTHQFDENQRISRPTIQSQGSGSLRLKAPSASNKNLCPPGHYMMFIFNGDGVPSKAKIVKIS